MSENTAALLAFMNLLTARLQIEEITSISETRNLVPIFLNLIKTGELVFQCDPDSNFTTAVNFISSEFSEQFVKHLHPENADRGDRKEISNIIMALIYVLRVTKETKFREFCEELDRHNNSKIAKLVERLDSLGRWSPAPIASVLYDSHCNLPSSTNCLETTEVDLDNKENNYTCTISEQALKTPASVLPTFTPLVRRTPRVTTNHLALNFDSPINKVLMSPRGEEVVRIHALTKEVESLRESKDLLMHEYGRLEELCHTKEREIIILEETVRRLNIRNSHLQSESERIPFLEERIINLEQLNAKQIIDIREAETKYACIQTHLSTVSFQRDEAFQKISLMEEDSKHLQAEFQKSKKQAQDELEMHNQTRKKIRDIERQLSNEIALLKKENCFLIETLENERRVLKTNIQQKEHEHEKQLEIVNEIKEHSEELQQTLHSQIQQKERVLQQHFLVFDEISRRINKVPEQSMNCSNKCEHEPILLLNNNNSRLFLSPF